MWSFVGKKSNKKWIWVILDKHTKKVIEYIQGDRSENTLKKLLSKLPKYILKRAIFYTDNWKAYNILPTTQRVVGKEYTRHIERFFLTVRNSCARFVRRGIRYSKCEYYQEIVLDLFIKYYNSQL
jgi:insertion element IS1 protein InsB